jgi:hypothetical protein
MNAWRIVVRRLLDNGPRRYLEEDYELLPSESGLRSALPTSNARRRSRRGILYALSHIFTFRRAPVLLALIPCFILLALLLQGVPPTYHDIRTYEAHLPQHNLTASKEGMYLRFPGHLWGHGLNNILQEA